MVLELWRDVVMKAILERFSPVALKVLSDEKVQALLTQALNLQADMRQNIEAQVKLVARTLELVTRDELSSLRVVVKNLESDVTRLRDEIVRRQAAAAQAAAAQAASAPAPAPKVAAAPAPAPAPKAAAAPKPAWKAAAPKVVAPKPVAPKPVAPKAPRAPKVVAPKAAPAKTPRPRAKA